MGVCVCVCVFVWGLVGGGGRGGGEKRGRQAAHEQAGGRLAALDQPMRGHSWGRGPTAPAAPVPQACRHSSAPQNPQQVQPAGPPLHFSSSSPGKGGRNTPPACQLDAMHQAPASLACTGLLTARLTPQTCCCCYWQAGLLLRPLRPPSGLAKARMPPKLHRWLAANAAASCQPCRRRPRCRRWAQAGQLPRAPPPQQGRHWQLLAWPPARRLRCLPAATRLPLLCGPPGC